MRARAEIEAVDSIRVTISISESVEFWRKLRSHLSKAVGAESNYAARRLNDSLREIIDKVENTVFHSDEGDTVFHSDEDK